MIQQYTPNKQLILGIKIWPEMFRELIRSRELIQRFFMRDLLGRYKQSLLGYFWIVIMPFVAIGSFVFLNKAGVLHIGATDMPYPLFALIGLSVWQLLAGGIAKGAQCITAAGGMISKINFPREALVFSSLGQVVFDFLVRFVLVILLFFVFQFVPSWGILLFPFALIPLFFLALGFAMVLAIINTIIRDTANVVTLLTTFLMFLTPVLYPVPPKFTTLYKFNPLTPLINAPRDLIAYGYIKEPFSFFVVSVLCLLLFLICWRIFHLVETKIPERL